MQVFVTSRAERNFDSIIDYIKQKWGERTAKQFVQKTDEIFKLLKNYPSWDKLKRTTLEGFNFHLKQESFTE
jgi:plasmid stabilization system protein ParE